MKSASQGHWQFRSAEDVSRFWEKHRHVPGRADGRKKYQEERFNLGVYLLALVRHDLLTYPFSIEQFEEKVSPDFMFTWESGETTGLEVTRATEQWFERRMTLADRELRNGQEGTAVLLSPLGWAGDQPEKEWCLLFEKAIEKKVAKLNIPNLFKPASNYDLLVYDETSLPTVDRQKVLTALRTNVRKLMEQEHALGKVSIVSSLDVIFDVGGACRILCYIEPPNLDDPASLQAFSERATYAAWFSAERAVQEHRRAGRPVYSTDAEGRIIKETPDGRFEVRLAEDGTRGHYQRASTRMSGALWFWLLAGSNGAGKSTYAP